MIAGEIQGAYQIKVTTSALALLLTSRHNELGKIHVQGHLIKVLLLYDLSICSLFSSPGRVGVLLLISRAYCFMKSGEGITTRSKSKSAPNQWVMLPLPTKVILFLYI